MKVKSSLARLSEEVTPKEKNIALAAMKSRSSRIVAETHSGTSYTRTFLNNLDGTKTTVTIDRFLGITSVQVKPPKN